MPLAEGISDISTVAELGNLENGVPMSLEVCSRFCNGRQSKSWRGLVIDDLPSARRCTGMALIALGGQITTASDGAQAVEIARVAALSGFDFDIIFTDIQMPGMDGLETTARIRTLGFTGPIVAISGSDESDIADRALAAGCDQFISKPATLQLLAAAVRRLCSGPRAEVVMTHA